MANCKKCDRCGTFYDYYGVEDHSEPVRHYNGMANAMRFCFETEVAGNVCDKTTRDLCSNCLGDLVRFMNNEVVLIEKYKNRKKRVNDI